MTRYVLRALLSQWKSWSGTVLVLAFAATLVNVCLAHRFSVTRPEVVATARAAGVSPAELEMSGLSIYIYSALVAIPVVAVVGQSCVQALRTNWARWRLAGAVPRQVFLSVIMTIATLGLVSCIPGILVGILVDQTFSSILTRIVSEKMGAIEVIQTPTTILFTAVSVVGIAVLGAFGPARTAVKVPATEAIREMSLSIRRMSLTRWGLGALWSLICAAQLFLAFTIQPQKIDDGLPAGGGQAMLAAILISILSVIIAPALVPGLLKVWSLPLAHLGGPWLVARRSTSWRASLSGSAVALLGLGFSFTAALMTNLYTTESVVASAHLPNKINQLDTLVMIAILGLIALLGAIAVVAMTSRSRQREFAILRCGGSTIKQIRAQAVIESLLYTCTALLLSSVPLIVTAVGEALFFHKAGLDFLPDPAIGPLMVVASVSFISLSIVLLAPVKKAYSAPIGHTLANE
ncbi:FtsX-like permease family protein [Corynebacterium matruchotii]|uniref:FtsX-like permease family protein n=1 Tax=Corynebacterium matruchotii TaxID=43768 RepID=UPI0028EC7EE1|nr:FtsX-like permease family protein [Corynebacterium matruchotii]